jgi:hypothetical protein
MMNRERVNGCFGLIKASAPECMKDLVEFFERVYIGYYESVDNGSSEWKAAR